MKKDFSGLLVDKKLVTKEQLDNAYKILEEKGGSLSELLVTLGYVNEKDLMIFLSTYLSMPPVKILNFKIPQEILDLVPKEVAKKYLVIPIGRVGKNLTVAIADPLNVLIAEDLEKITGHKITPVIASRTELKQAMEIHYKESITSAVEEIIKDSDNAAIEIIREEKEDIKDEEILKSIDEAPIIKMTNFILKKAVEEKASDVLIEPFSNYSRVRFRQDGVLREVQQFLKKMHNFVISRIKVIANLNITEHRLPQDGRFRMNIVGKDVDFRVSIMPSTLGEKAVLRILDKSSGLLNLDVLGFSPNIDIQLKNDSLCSFGMILACGPTGSGKTTTLYSILRHVYSPEKNVITVEDPIEYQLEGINQVNVNYEVDLTFAAALRSILRQDPDIIMVGEIRDFDTVDIAIKAALTGHLVLSTLHTTTAAGAVTRLVNMGVEPFLLTSTLIGVLSQRLVRKLCPKCREPQKNDQEIKEKYKIKSDAVIYKPKGCNSCGNLGYRGRVAIGEYLHMSADVRRLVNDLADEHQIKRQARSEGMRSLRQDGIKKVEEGQTSLEEILRASVADED